MASKGFSLEKMLKVRGVTLNTPPLFCSKTQFTPEEVRETVHIAKRRICIKR